VRRSQTVLATTTGALSPMAFLVGVMPDARGNDTPTRHATIT
jgi:hypothetical protein